MNAEKINDDATTTTDSAQADAPQSTAADKAALAAGGNSLGGARFEAHTDAEYTLAFASWDTGALLDHADAQIALFEQATPPNDNDDAERTIRRDALADIRLANLGTIHHQLFCRRVDSVEHAQRRDAFHERLHVLRARVSEAKRVAGELRTFEVRRQREQAKAQAVLDDKPTVSAPQPMGGVVDAAVKAMREEWRQDVTHTNNIVNSLVIEMGQLRGRSMRLVERVAALEAAQKQASFDAQVQSARIDVWGSTAMRTLLKESDVTHITSEAEMVEAFGDGRGQAMWAECEARKSGGAK